jgi:hypothetical protein
MHIYEYRILYEEVILHVLEGKTHDLAEAKAYSLRPRQIMAERSITIVTIISTIRASVAGGYLR